jgi:ribosomal protein S18 acetylase RimI-like enzyme
VTKSEVGIRAFDRDRDLQNVLSFVGRSRERGDDAAIFHPGGLQWWLRRLDRPGFDVAIFDEDSAVVAFALRDRSDVIVQADRAHSAERLALLAWIESRARDTGQSELVLSVPEADRDLRHAALTRGYEPTETYGYELVRDLDGEPARAALPRGFEIISLTPALADPYVELHRAAWSRPKEPSTYDRHQHDLVTAMPGFRFDLVPIIAATDGRFSAYCMSWWDPLSASVEIEPLGTHPDFRRKGLARAIVLEVVRRSSRLGAKYVLVWATSSNPEAKALYLSAGLGIRRVLRDHRLALVS